MRVLNIEELMLLTRIRLCDLLTRITAALADLPDGAPSRRTP
jgi:hypothetical protein